MRLISLVLFWFQKKVIKENIIANISIKYLLSFLVFNQYFEKNGGAIVNIIADMFRGFPLMAHTGAARAAVDNLTK